MVELDLDEKDLEILRWLDREGEIDVDQLSDELGISTSTIYYRLDNYREKGILKGNVADIDHQKLGFELTAISEIKSEYGPGYEGIADRLTELSGVQSVYFMLGEMSFILISRLRDHEHLQTLIDDIIHTEGVEHSSTHIVLKEFKDESRLLVNYDDDDLAKLIDDGSADD
ncbi:Lrp/AsnC family transcriptional regulator [Halosolutus amylolyticus]|uniref:Lrp/AsnC family transcriptional regulator n=1 Tax=Halosolutus amylolyticus TaxID=2932267 RepID=A0ABD5PK56_9EURY|nr:Lrp/AsnC family transcriptional regulator [Halosolutus amylolyticus]